MTCESDLCSVVSEIEMLVKDHAECGLDCLGRSKSRKKPTTNHPDESYTMKVTLDVFVKLHEMLENYIGLINFGGGKSRGPENVRIPLNEALDVALRAMISAMHSSCTPYNYPTLCPHRTCISTCDRRESFNVDVGESVIDKLCKIEEVDIMLEKLKDITLESVKNVESKIKDVLGAIGNLPATAMKSRLEILSSVVRNMKNKLISCGQPLAESLMGTQVNPISQIISEFILEYGQIKSRVHPCRKICRFCGSVINPTDRQRDVLCCEKSKRLNFLRTQWVQQNSLKGVAKWDEDTIMKIVDSCKGPCVSTCTAKRGQKISRPSTGWDGEGDTEKSRGHRLPLAWKREHSSKSSPDFSRRKNRGGDSRLKDSDPRSGKDRSKVGRFGAGDRPGSKSQRNDNRFPGPDPSRYEKGRYVHVFRSDGRNSPEHVNDGKFDVDETGRKKGARKNKKLLSEAGREGVEENEDNGPQVSVGRKKSGKKVSGPRKGEGASDAGDKREEKFHRKKRGVREEVNNPENSVEHDSGKIPNVGKSSGSESTKKEQSKIGRAGTVDEDGERKHGAIKFEKVDESVDNKETEGDRLDTGDKNLDKNSDGTIESTKGREGFDDATVGEHGSAGVREKTETTNGTPEAVSTTDSTAGGSTNRENIIKYRLSNDLFVELGWTILPKDKVMQRAVEFQALQAKPHMNWLKNNRIRGKRYYPDEKTIFLNFLEDGSGHVYYPDGKLAIAAKVSKKETHELYKVYSQEEKDVMGVMRPPKVIGIFDSMANGIVYDEDCDVRLSYNQNGGVLLDTPTKVPFSWKWNNFETPPIEEEVYENPATDGLPPEFFAGRLKTADSKSSMNSKSLKVTQSSEVDKLDEPSSGTQKSQKSETIDHMNVKLRKIVTQMKPVCLKLNKHLSLRVFDRRNINLKFLDGRRRVRIELGTEVNPNVRIKSELVDRNDWSAKVAKNRFYLQDTNCAELTPEGSLCEIAGECQRAKKEANSRRRMIAKYRPHLMNN